MRRSKARPFVILIVVAVAVPLALLAKSRLFTSHDQPAQQAEIDVIDVKLLPAAQAKEEPTPPVSVTPATTPPAITTSAPATSIPAPSFVPTPPPQSAPSPTTATASAPAWPPASQPASRAASHPASAPTAMTPAGSLAEAQSLLAAGKLLQARAIFADALNSGKLSDADNTLARQKLLELADRMIFSREVVAGDPCTFGYQVRPGDMIIRIERDQKLHVPTQLITSINNIKANKLLVGQTLKLIRGPFHAVVYKGRFILDLYLQEADTGRMILAKSFRVGLGRDGCTPLGKWRLALGGKIKQAPWAAPPATGETTNRTVRWGESGYPLGKEGYWISLEGIEGNALSAADGYGIHGTNDPDSIGQAASMGCIRLSDPDIEAVFSMLYEQWSTVTILP